MGRMEIGRVENGKDGDRKGGWKTGRMEIGREIAREGGKRKGWR